MTGTKLYPFSTVKHAHDIEYRRNRAKNEICDVLSGEVKMSDEEFEKLCDLEEALTDLLEAVLSSRDGRVCWLAGKQYGLAKECVEWARNSRASSLIKSGKTQFLQYI